MSPHQTRAEHTKPHQPGSFGCFPSLSQGWAFEWGMQMLSQLMHKEITQNCFSWQHPTQLSVQQPQEVWPRRLLEGLLREHPHVQGGGREENQGLPPSPSGKKKEAGGSPNSSHGLKSNLEDRVIKTLPEHHLDDIISASQGMNLGKFP